MYRSQINLSFPGPEFETKAKQVEELLKSLGVLDISQLHYGAKMTRFDVITELSESAMRAALARQGFEPAQLVHKALPARRELETVDD